MILHMKGCKTSNSALYTNMKQKRNRVFGWTLPKVGMLACFLFIFAVLFSSASANELVAAPPPSSSSSTLDKKPLPSPEVKAPSPSPTKPKIAPKPKPKPTTGAPVPPTTPSITAEDCSRVRKKYVALNFPLDNVAGSPIPGKNFQFRKYFFVNFLCENSFFFKPTASAFELLFFKRWWEVKEAQMVILWDQLMKLGYLLTIIFSKAIFNVKSAFHNFHNRST